MTTTPFAPCSLQTLHRYYEQLRPSVIHWYSHTHSVTYLYFSLSIMTTGSRSSQRKPSKDSRPLYAGHRLHSIRNSPANSSQEIETPLVLMPISELRRVNIRFGLTRLSLQHLIILKLLPFPHRSLPILLIPAA